MRALVTGANGQDGSYLCEQLPAKCGAFHHPAGTAARAEAAPLTAEGHQPFGMAIAASHE